MKEPVVLSWSGGKDSALALYELRLSGRYDVVSLLTTVAEEYDRVSHHGVRTALLEKQAAALGLPLNKVYLPTQASVPCRPDQNDAVMTVYEELMREAVLAYKTDGISTVAFGDIFLVRLREYREAKLAEAGMQGLFPLWQRDTAQLVQTFVRLGFKARLTCVDGTKLGREFAGRVIDDDFIRDLPADVDPCGENGEYHSFVYDGPIYQQPIDIECGEVVQRDQRYFIDLVPAVRCQTEVAPPSGSLLNITSKEK